MCDLCAENGHGTCPDCGCLMCFDAEGDDVMRRAVETRASHICCERCAVKYGGAVVEREKSYHCWNCGGKLSPVKIESDGTIVGTCWLCRKDNISAVENEDNQPPESTTLYPKGE